ncbi:MULTISPECIES: hypothetical protein [unclassified Pseudomonas]|uniref:hypothetical protein n=1 Tax=unclassified Pseudomonas TaxID=196821 RepID=UPI0013022B46
MESCYVGVQLRQLGSGVEGRDRTARRHGSSSIANIRAHGQLPVGSNSEWTRAIIQVYRDGPGLDLAMANDPER